ncbi:hypothetical protein BU17DRAFT_72589 [Hysterangium stoloniferum]|nr:hypothetical protein BU17DRAFT_72589 [Hysterangium stoloniferum]
MYYIRVSSVAFASYISPEFHYIFMILFFLKKELSSLIRIELFLRSFPMLTITHNGEIADFDRVRDSDNLRDLGSDNVSNMDRDNMENMDSDKYGGRGMKEPEDGGTQLGRTARGHNAMF